MKNIVKHKKETLTERIEHDEGSWAKLGEQLSAQTTNMYGQLGDIYRVQIRLQERVEKLEKLVAKLQKKIA